MKKIFLILSIYLLGCFFAYKYTKHNLQSPPASIKTWKVGDRNFAIFLSIGSWITVSSMGIVDFIHYISNDDTPAAW